MIKLERCILIVVGILDLISDPTTNSVLALENRSDSSATTESISGEAIDLGKPLLTNNKKHVYNSRNRRKNEESKVEDAIFSNLFAIHLERNSNMDHILKSGLVLVRKVFEDENIYLFRYPNTSILNKSYEDDIVSSLSIKKQIRWIARQHVLHRHPRWFPVNKDSVRPWKRHLNSNQKFKRRSKIFEKDERFSNLMNFNDPLFDDQWYLFENSGSSPHFHDVNVVPVWKAGITGRGIRISVLDDGVSPENAEVTDNYDSVISHDLSEFQTEVQPNIEENSHGTYCAAIVAGVANNSYCGVGVAFNAKIGGARVLNGLITDAQEASGLIHALAYVDIYTASWGPKDDGRHVAGPGFLTRKALLKGVTKGRKGRGAIYVWASGNGGRYFDNCNLDGYASSPFTLTFGALTEKGESTYYSEPCASVLASTYVGGLHFPPTKRNLASYRKMVKVIVPDTCGKCRKNFQGTSAAAPIAAGIIALILEVNPQLAWRDVQHLIINTARIPSSVEDGWSLNAIGKHFHPKIGFGVLDAALAVSNAFYWTPVRPLMKFSSTIDKRKWYIKKQAETILTMHVDDVMEEDKVNILETVIATVNIMHPRCGHLEIRLVSPSGTVSQVLTKRPLDNTTVKFPMVEFTTLHFWGENPTGRWKIIISDQGGHTNHMGYINYFQLTFHGTFSDRESLRTIKPRSSIGSRELKQIMDEEQAVSEIASAELSHLWDKN